MLDAWDVGRLAVMLSDGYMPSTCGAGMIGWGSEGSPVKARKEKKDELSITLKHTHIA